MRVWAVLIPRGTGHQHHFECGGGGARLSSVTTAGATRFDQRNQTSDHDDTRDAEDDDAGVDEASDIE